MKFQKTLLPQIVIFFFTTLGSLNAEELVIWISSFQDQVYYEQMGELYSEKKKSDVTINVKAYGFREMPDKLGVAIRSGQGIPDIVQLDETFFGVFLNQDSPFMDLSKKVKSSGLAKDLHPKTIGGFHLQRQSDGGSPVIECDGVVLSKGFI